MKPALIILVATAIREAFSFWTGHPFDFELWVRLGYYTYRGVDPYGVLPSVPGLSFANVFSSSSTATIGYFAFWPFVEAAMYALYNLIGAGDRFVYYFLLKQPAIVGDVLLAYMIYLLVNKDNPTRASWSMKVWAFMPLTIIISGIWGIFDSLAMAFVIAAVITPSYVRRSLGSGIGTLVKSVPMIYALPLTVTGMRRWWGLLVSVLLPSSVTVGAALYFHWSLVTVSSTLASTATKGGQSMSLFDLVNYMNVLGILSDQAARTLWPLGYIWIPAVLAATTLSVRAFGSEDTGALLRSMLVATLVFLIFKSQVNEQYAIYLLALSVADVALLDPRRMRLLAATALVATVYLLVNNLFLIRFLAPVFPQAVQLDLALDLSYSLQRSTLAFLLGVGFTLLNIFYLYSLWKDARISTPGPGSRMGRPSENQTSARPVDPIACLKVSPSTKA
ncbi:MAG: hypothetical protein LYZ70_00850 [Nitrososphaerales archaeon]|nr:hypothetical protein [Nitrososphaerales archaeon]